MSVLFCAESGVGSRVRWSDGVGEGPDAGDLGLHDVAVGEEDRRVMPMPTPPGVPVRTTSPGRRTVKVETYASRPAQSKTSVRVLPRCRSSPLTRHTTSTPATGSIASGGTTTGPIGVVASHALPWNHWSVRFCQSRTEMSLATV